MAISYLLKINGVQINKLKKFKVGRNKLWTDAGRNMAGELKSTFIGIFPKISLEFAHMTQAEMQTILALLDLPSFTVEWWDETSGTFKSGTYYAGDFENSVFDMQKGIYEPLAVNLIPFKKI